MRIKKAEAFPLRYPEIIDNNNIRHIVLVRLETDTGIVGWGECVTIFRENAASVAALLRHGLLEVVQDRDPLENITLWQALRQRVWWYGDVGGIAAFAISAVDMALWDLKGKILNQPLYTLLGGKKHERLPACASIHPKGTTIDELAAEMASYIEAGYQLVKVGFGKKGTANLGFDAARDIAFARAVRAAMGPDAGFMIDVGARLRWDVPYAVRMARAFAEIGLYWLEDPFHPDNLRAYHHLRAAVPDLPIAFGERLFTLDAFHRILEADVCDIILVDAGRAEGITGVLQVVELAAQFNVKFNPHTYSSAVNTAAAIHLALCAERPSIFELMPLPSVMQVELATNPIRHVDGWVTAPDAPGLGVEVVEETVQKYLMEI
ncbi:MAG: mandelate racemase/muconate lactonizing enzyme family protein [Chloroflexi bacterium]|nr:mandelate racemase/muconate lactonizing enzyme family protein [Chloroflexota bacterium]